MNLNLTCLNLTCSRCGLNAQAERQWYRCEPGLGICSDCFNQIAAQNIELAIQVYGVPGIHHSIKAPQLKTVQALRQMEGLPPMSIITGELEAPVPAKYVVLVSIEKQSCEGSFVMFDAQAGSFDSESAALASIQPMLKAALK